MLEIRPKLCPGFFQFQSGVQLIDIGNENRFCRCHTAVGSLSTERSTGREEMIPTSPIKMLLVGDQNYGQVRGTPIETVLKWPRWCVPVPGEGLRGMERSCSSVFRASLSWRGIYSPAP